MDAIARYFKFAERGTDFATEIRAGLTTFLVMAYIIFVNPSILSQGLGIDPGAAAAATALVAGVLTIAMGVVGNYPFAIAAGLGLNAVVAVSLPALGLTPAGAMGVIVLEGLAITALVIVGLREAIMEAVPLGLKRSIGVGIGLFILFIGLNNGGLIALGTPSDPVTLRFPTTTPQFVFLFGLALTVGLWVLRIRGALIISIVVTTVVALIAGVAQAPASYSVTPSFATLGQFDLGNVFATVPLVVALVTIFAIMLSDFFDTMGTVTGIAAEAGLADEKGRVEGIGRVLLVDSLAAVAGGAAGISSNTTYIESAAGVAEGGRTGFTSVVVGVLFLVAILVAPLAGVVPKEATAPALVLVGYLMFSLIKDIPVSDVEEGIPALLTMIVMPLTFTITTGIGAGFISWVFIKVLRRKWAEIHPLMWVVALGFVVFFLQDAIKALVG